MGYGLIAAAGAAAGLGEGLADVGKRWNVDTYEKEKAAALEQREINLAKLNNQFAAERQQEGFAHDLTMEDTRDAHATAQQAAGFEHEETSQRLGFEHNENLAYAQQQFTKEENMLNRGMTQAQIASNEKIAAMNRGSAMAIAKMGGSVTQDTQGRMIWVDRSGKASQMMDPSDPTKPLQGYKDLSPAAKALTDVIKAQLVDLDRMEQAAVTSGDQTGLAAINQRRGILNAQFMQAVTSGVNGFVAKGEKGAPDAAASWDSTSKEVTLNGEKIGTANNADEATKLAQSKMALKAQAAADKAKPAQSTSSAPSASTPRGPEAGSPAATAIGKRKGIMEQRDADNRAREGAAAQTRMNAQDQFNVDVRHMTTDELVKKYEGNMSQLTVQQQAELFRMRNPYIPPR